MLDKFKEIVDGWKNHIAPPEELKETIESISKSRLEICTPCEYNSTPGKIKVWSRCKQCGCPLIQKSKSLQSKCPVDKWGPMATKEEEQTIKLAIDGKKHSQEGTPVETSNRNQRNDR